MMHAHRMRVATPDGPVVTGTCECGYTRDYATAGPWEGLRGPVLGNQGSIAPWESERNRRRQEAARKGLVKRATKSPGG